MELGRKYFKANEVETLPNGELHFNIIPTKKIDPPIPDGERPGTALGPSMHDTTTLQKKVLASMTIARLESDTDIEMEQKENRGEFNTRPKGPPDATHSDIKTDQRPPEEFLCDRDAAEEDLPKPSFTPDTYILIRNGDKASWIQLWTATRDATVVQSLPSRKNEDLLGARVTTIETLCPFECPTGRVDVVQMGKAYIIAHHHIKTEDGWMTARQAADRGLGTLLTNHTHMQLYSLRLTGGGNIIIDTSVTPDKAPTQIETATMGYRFEPSADPQHEGSLTYPLQEVSPWEDRAAQAKPSYCCVVQRHLTGMSGRPTPQSAPSAPKTIAQLEPNIVTESANREYKGEPNMESIGPPSTSQLDPRTGQRPSEEYGSDLDIVLTATDTMRPGQPPVLETCCTYSSHLALRASVPAPLQKRELAPTITPQPMTDTEIYHTSTTNQETVEQSPKPYHNSTHELQTDIYLQNPKGEHVPGHEVQWELNPYAMVCGDTSGLMGIVPAHHHLWANTTATTLCTLVQSDPRSQFYKTSPKRECSPTLQPSWSLGKEKVINSQKRSASRRQALEARNMRGTWRLAPWLQPPLLPSAKTKRDPEQTTTSTRKLVPRNPPTKR